MRRLIAVGLSSLFVFHASAAWADDFAAGSLIIPMDTTYQDSGMLKAFGLVYDLLRKDVPVRWVIRPGKAHLGVDFTASAIDHKSKAVIAAHGYRGGPWVIDSADAAKAIPIINAWQTANPTVAVHEVTAPFWGDVSRYLIAAPTIAMHADGHEDIARGYLQAAGIPDSTLDPTWPATSPDMLTPAEVAGPTTTNHHDGKLFDSDGDPVYCQFMSMHWDVTKAAASPETVVEVRSFLMNPVHFFAECQAVNAFEGAPPTGGRGDFLTDQGFAWPAPSQPKTVDFYNDDSPFAQLDGAFATVGGSEPAYSLPTGGKYKMGGVVMITKSGTPEGDSDVWMTGFLDGACPPYGEYCANNYGKVSYLGGHQYSTSVPISKNPSTQGTRLFLNSLFEAPCATRSGQPRVFLQKTAPATSITGTVTFTLDYGNSGPGVALKASVSDALPSGATFVSATGGGTLSNGSITWNVGNLGVNESGQVSFTVKLPNLGSYDNVANLNYKVGLNSFALKSNTTTTIYDQDSDGDGVVDSVDTCPSNYNPAQDLQTDVRSCGSCGTICSVASGTPGCQAGTCVILACRSGMRDCNHTYADGCEYNSAKFSFDTNNCGGCGRVCAPDNATGNCIQGSCQVGTCDAGFSDCDTLEADGCEYDDSGFSGDPSNCGGCGIVCDPGLVCSGGKCSVSNCPTGTADCDQQATNGCEIATSSDTANCGGCGVSCARANALTGCSAGECTFQGCGSGHSDCDGIAANGCEYDDSGFASDPLNCGGCNVACSASNAAVACSAGACTITGCTSGFSDCDGLEANGCEYANSGFASDLANCGACGKSCAPANAAGACSSGVCSVLSCDAGFVDVDGVVADGCECHMISNTDTTCDGIDDDCNGITDDGYQGATCGQGVCESHSRCVSGSVVACAPGSASVEGPSGDSTCTDGVDNDCDGQSDDLDPDCAAVADAGTAGAGGAATTTGGASNGGAATGGASNGGASNGGASSGGVANGGASGALGSGGITGSGGVTTSSGGSAGSSSTSTGGSEPTDAGTDTDAALDGSTNVAGSHDSGGCGCRTTRTSNNAYGAAWASLLVIAFGIRRRRALSRSALRDARA